MKVEYELLGQVCNPVNRSEIFLEVNHDQQSVIDQPKPHVGINNLYFAREDILKVMNYLNASPGITEGAPFNIKITERGVTNTINMYLNLMDGFKRSNDGIEASVKMLQSLDWLDDKVDGFTFESLYNDVSSGPITIDSVTYSSYQNYFDRKFIYIPYVLSSIPNRQDAFMSLFSAIYVIVQLSNTIKTILQWAIPMEGFGVVMGVAQLVAEIAFALLLLASLVALMEHLFNSLMQPIKYHGSMLLVDMLKVASHKMGLKFNSTIWNSFPYNQIAYLPEKFNPIQETSPSSINIFGISLFGFAKTGFMTPGYAPSGPHDSSTSTVQKGYLEGTGGDLMRLVKRYCNGKIIIPDQTNDLILERRDFYPATSAFQLPDIRQDWNGYNTDELVANILIKFAADLNDKNCISFISASGNPFYTGTVFQATTSQITTVNQALVGIKGLREISIDAARGVGKDKLSFLEQLHKDLTIAFIAVENAGLLAINAAILLANVAIVLINYYIGIWNLLMGIVVTICNVLNSIISTINDIIDAVNNLGGSLSNISGNINFSGFFLPLLNFIPFMSFVPFNTTYPNRLDALLLENDMVTTPKLIMVDTSRSEFTAPGGFAGQQRIAYVHAANTQTVHAQRVWNDFYHIDAFVGTPNSRATKISPALNKASERNPFLLSLADFNVMVSNPKINDNFGEPVITDTIQWYIEKNGIAEIEFRKAGWLRNPQSNDGLIRSQEININLQIKTSLPNGQ